MAFEQKNLLEIYAMIFVTFRFYKYYGYMDTEKCIQSIFNAYLIYIKNEFCRNVTLESCEINTILFFSLQFVTAHCVLSHFLRKAFCTNANDDNKKNLSIR